MTLSRPLRASTAVRGLVARLGPSVRRVAGWTERRVTSRRVDQDEAQFTVHVDQALQIVSPLPAPRIVALPGGRAEAIARR